MSAVSVDPLSSTFVVGRTDSCPKYSWKKQRVHAPGTADSPQASAPLPADMSVDAGASPSGQNPPSPESNSVDPPDEGTNQIDPDSVR